MTRCKTSGRFAGQFGCRHCADRLARDARYWQGARRWGWWARMVAWMREVAI